MPGQHLVQLGSRMVGDTAQHVGKPRLRIDAVEFRRADLAFHYAPDAHGRVGDNRGSAGDGKHCWTSCGFNGSFLTEKINPADTDVVLEVDASSMYDNGSREQKDAIDWIVGNLRNTPLKCDFYPLFTYPIPHLLLQEGEWWRAYWIRQFGFNREVDPKEM